MPTTYKFFSKRIKTIIDKKAFIYPEILNQNHAWDPDLSNYNKNILPCFIELAICLPSFGII